MYGRRVSEADVFETYRKTFKAKLLWEDILPTDISEWIAMYESATNCPRTLIMPSVLTLTSCLCGPHTSVASDGNSFVSPLNQFVFAVCAPGGGKSNTYDRIISPVMEEIEKLCGNKITLESYTTAGIQRNQQQNGGYGIITGDEGEMFLLSITQKQKQGESERALLCKMWNSKGDATMLASGSRSFNKTSMSACIFIQPQVFVQELMQLSFDDGLIDRFLVFSSKPVFKTTSEIKENATKLADSNMKDFVTLFKSIYNDHKDVKRKYHLSDEAQDYYNDLVDNNARFIQDKYNSVSGKLYYFKNKYVSFPGTKTKDVCCSFF